MILPREISEDGVGLYDSSVITFAKELRTEGIAADYEHDSEHRQWIAEEAFSGEAIAVVVGIISNAGWAAINALLHKRGSSPTKVKIARCVKSPDRTVWEWYEVEGKGSDVAKVLARLAIDEGPSAGSS